MRTTFRMLLLALGLGIALGTGLADAQSAMPGFGKLGTGDGEFIAPTAIRFDGKGRIFVLDVDRMETFDLRGNYVSSFGKFGTGEGEFNNDSTFAFDPNGDIVIANDVRVQRFDGSGRYKSRFLHPTIDDGGFISVSALAIDSHGIIYLADRVIGRVQAFDRDGKFLFKCEAPAGVERARPLGLFVDRDDRLYVADAATHQILVYDNAGKLTSAFGSEHLVNPVAITRDQFGIFYVIDGANDEQPASVVKFDRNGGFLLEFTTAPGAPIGFDTLVGVAVDPQGTLLAGDRVPPVYVLDQVLGQVVKLDLLGNYLSSWGTFGRDDGQFVGPNGAALSHTGELYVTDVARTITPRVQAFSLDGEFREKLANVMAADVAFGALTNFLLATDAERDQVNVYVLRGPVLRQTFGSHGSGPGQIDGINGVASDGNVAYVSDANNHRLQVFRAAAQGDPYTHAGQFTYQAARPFIPHGIAPVRNGVVVADEGNQQLVKFTTDGQVERIIGSRGMGDGQFDNVQYVAADSEGGLFATDNHRNIVQKFSSDGTFRYRFGGTGSSPDSLNAPEGIVITGGRIFVVDAFNARIAIFAEDVKRDRDRDARVGSEDLDQDGDGIADAIEGDGDTDGDGVPDALDLDSDQDGICDVIEVGLPATADCRFDDTVDENGNGLADSVDPDTGANALVPLDTDGDGTPDYLDGDADNDGRCDVRETRGGVDANRDCVYDNETDVDGDGLADALYPINGRPLVLIDSDGDGLDDHIDATDDSTGNDDDSCAVTAPRQGSNGLALLSLMPLLLLAGRAWLGRGGRHVRS